MVPCRNPRRKNVVQIDLLREENRLTLKSSLWVRFVCIFGISGFNFFIWFFLFLYKKLGNIGYDTKKNSEDILSRRRQCWVRFGWNLYQLLPDIWNFVWGGKKCAFKLPKVPDLAKYVKKRQKIFTASATWSPKDWNFVLNLLTLFAKIWESQTQKNSIKNFYWPLFPTPQ